ncbi:ABC transporter [Sulfurifustis variabilis]|uniref:ABC transporter n=1 Tax=Sulfurifustis variabilis TaxID=1675686 RepID=A0A1B4V701_9GAMM|nr:GldG family protein [Sulfurifustis variabilis]BAU47074.1 ABC transporter [Sulfurifustis variabilis]
MRRIGRARWQFWLVNASFVVLFLVAVGLLQWISQEYHWRFDLTQNGMHSLSEASRAALDGLPGEIRATAYVDRTGEARRFVREAIRQYQAHKSDFTLEFVDSDVEPDRVREAGVLPGGELFLGYKDATERIPLGSLNEETLTNALTRLGRSGERWIVFLAGHGERSPDREANFDVSSWAAELKKRGLKTRTLTLGENPQIPENTTVLVVADPQTQLLPGEVKQIEEYVKRGGNLLWLADPGPLHGLERVAEALGVELQPGVLVDPLSAAVTGDAGAIVVSRYTGHPVVKNFPLSTFFVQSSGIAVRPPGEWQSHVLFDTRETAWSETGALKGEVRFDKGRDIPGPLNLAVALTREVEGREQRVVIVGDGDFLSNSIIANGGNLELGMSVANWLSRDDAYVNIPVRTARDRTLSLSRTARIVMGGGFLFVLPIALLGGGLAMWWRRRRR